MSRRRGFTLIEMLMAIVIVGAVTLILFPKMTSAMVKVDVRGARTTLANVVAKARAAATTTSRQTAVRVVGNRVMVTARPRLTPAGAGTIDTLGGVQDLNALYGVSVSPGSGGDSIPFDPRGIRSLGGTVKITVARSGHTDSVVIDPLGRVLK